MSSNIQRLIWLVLLTTMHHFQIPSKKLLLNVASFAVLKIGNKVHQMQKRISESHRTAEAAIDTLPNLVISKQN
jgi:hypothetical protein